jgi:hypothetical protein
MLLKNMWRRDGRGARGKPQGKIKITSQCREAELTDLSLGCNGNDMRCVYIESRSLSVNY